MNHGVGVRRQLVRFSVAPRRALLPNDDVMADVLAFFPRRVLSLKLAGVNVAFSALCSCWCQPEEAEAAFIVENLQQRKWNKGFSKLLLI